MKHLSKYKYLLAAFAIVLLGVHCKQDRNVSVQSGRSDTTLVVGIYKNLLDSSQPIQFGEMRRIVKDDYQWSDKDSTTRVRKWVRDSFYLIILQTPIADSSMVKKWNMPMFDSLGRRNRIPLYYIYDKKWVRDGWGNADSAIAQLKRVQ